MSETKNEKEVSDFESGFDSSIKEYIVLTERSAGALKAGGAVMWTANLMALAVIDTETDRLYNEKTRLRWLMTDEQNNENMLFGFEGGKIYRIKARESISEGIKMLMVCEVMERECSESRLEAVLDEYNKAVTISASGCRELVLDKSLNIFEGECIIGNFKFTLMLDIDNAEDCSECLELWDNIYNDFSAWEKKAREFAAEELLDTADDWGYDIYCDEHIDDDPEGDNYEDMTAEAFAGRIKISDVVICSDGTFTFDFNDDDIFLGHTIAVEGNLDEGFTDAAF